MQSIVRTTTAAGRGQLARAKKMAVPLGNEANMSEPSTLEKGASSPQGKYLFFLSIGISSLLSENYHCFLVLSFSSSNYFI